VSRQKSKNRRYAWWLFVGLFSALITSPNALFLKIATSQIDGFTMPLLRSIVLVIALLPTVTVASVRYRKQIKKAKKDILIAAVCLGSCTVAFAIAIYLGPASHVQIVALLTPILLVVFVAKIIHEKIKRRAKLGIVVAAIGGLLAVALPAIAGKAMSSSFNVLQILFALANSVLYALALVYLRRSREQGVPIFVVVILSGFVTIILAIMGGLAFSKVPMLEQIRSLNWTGWLIVLFNGLIVGILSRILSVSSYRHIDAAVAGGIEYLNTILGIMLPLVVLGEKLSPELIGGGLLMLIGIYVAEGHKHMHRHRFGIRYKNKDPEPELMVE